MSCGVGRVIFLLCDALKERGYALVKSSYDNFEFF